MRWINQVLLESIRKLQDPRGGRLPNHWVMYSEPEMNSVMPFIAMRQSSISPTPVGSGTMVGTTKSVSTENFIGDGTNRRFKLANPIFKILSVTDSNADPDYTYTNPDYYTIDKDSNDVVFDTSVIPKDQAQIQIIYSRDPDMKEMEGYRLDCTYTFIIYAKKNSQGKDDEIFEIDGEKTANGSLIDYLFEQFIERITLDYDWFRKRQLQVFLGAISENVYDAETRRFAKQVQLRVQTDFVVDRKQLPIVQPPGTYNINVGI